jgi:hypothetical protein
MSINTLERDVARLLQEGQDAARRGDKAMARALLTQLVEQDPRNEEGWMWLSGVVTDADEQQICLENALVINPYNAHARKGLEFVLTKTNTPARVPLAPPASIPAEPQVPANPAAQAWAEPATYAFPAPAQPEHAFSESTEALHVEDVSPFEVPSVGSASSADAIARMQEPFALAGNDMMADFDGEPFIPPGMEEMLHSTTITGPTGNLLNALPDELDDELPNWLQELTPSVQVPAHPEQETPYSPFTMPDYASQQSNGAGMPGPNVMNGMPPAPVAAPFGPADFEGLGDFGIGGSAPSPMNAGPVGPFSDLPMPAPHELPGGNDGFGPQNSNAAQPWYLQQGKGGPSQHGNGSHGSSYLDSTMLESSALNSSMLTSTALEEQRRNKAVATMPCPNCATQVNETALACAHCRYSFFVNCPYCHELIDTSEAVPDQVEPCPYCSKEINRWTLGLGGAPDLVSQKNPGSRPAGAGAGPDPAFPAMKQTLEINTERQKGLSFGWVVDLLWLIAIVGMVWALTQLPTWLHLSGQY